MPVHPYQRSPHSNAGNCECGMAEESRIHPHAFTQAYRSNGCVCAYPADHPIHTDADTAQPNPVYPEQQAARPLSFDAAREAVRKARGNDACPATPITWT
ncbi:hypothetical protein [Streptomyces aureus]|uniref:hypothetical protein n=1 Tax=Streptomyces aureus TaxID=193461 RepID=UPI0036A00C83